ncbi:DUF4595 domain-containing protein, partial [Alistipes sp.]|uniref:DUF4595 domain-containing protein n=1 Tax=Alistipes sp. TaxID=1872444 RepID=UPI0025B87429
KEIVLFTYGDQKVSYEITRQDEDGIDPRKDTGSVELDESGRAVSGEYAFYEKYDDTIPTSDSYKLFYDTEGYLKKLVSNYQNQGGYHHTDETRITWTEGNPTEVWSFKVWDDGTSDESTNKASYGTAPNKTNLDLNWIFVLSGSEDWRYVTGDSDDLFSLIGLTGKRSKHMAREVPESPLIYADGERVYEYTYETDADGLLTKITRITKKTYGGKVEKYKSFEAVITYAE